MPSIVVSFPASGSSDASAGTIAWTDPSNVTSSNGDLASSTTGFALASLTAANPESEYLVALYASPTIRTDAMGAAGAVESVTGIPSDATIVGIEVVVEANQYGTTGTVAEIEVRLVKGGAIQTSADNKSASRNLPNSATSNRYQAGYYTYGSHADLWGVTLTYADINAGDFGVAIRYTGDGANDVTVAVDTIMVRVFYTRPAFTAVIRDNSGESTRQAPWVWHLHMQDSSLSTYDPEACLCVWELLEWPDGFDPGTYADPRRGVPAAFQTRSKRVKHGFNVAWELTHAGDYRARLTIVSPNGQTRTTAEATVTVAASTRTVRYVDGNAAGANNGTSLADAWTSISDAYTWIDSNPSGFILELEGGQTHTHTAIRSLASVSNAVIRTRPGSGTPAKITRSAYSAAAMVTFTTASTNVIVKGVTFYSSSTANLTNACDFTGTVHNVAVIDCNGENLYSFLELSTVGRHKVFISGCDGGDTFRYSVGIFGTNKDVVVEGCTLQSRGTNGAEGIVRVQFTTRLNLRLNNYSQLVTTNRQGVKCFSSWVHTQWNYYNDCGDLTFGIDSAIQMSGLHIFRCDGDDLNTAAVYVVLANLTETSNALVVNPVLECPVLTTNAYNGGVRRHRVRHALKRGAASSGLLSAGVVGSTFASAGKYAAVTNSIMPISNPETATTGWFYQCWSNDDSLEEAGGNIHPLNNDGVTSRNICKHNNTSYTLATWNALAEVGTDIQSRLPYTYLDADAYWALTDYSWSGTVASASSSTVFTLDSSASDQDDYYNGGTFTINGDTGLCQDYVGSTRQVTLVAGLAGGTPSVSDAASFARDFSTERSHGKAAYSTGAQMDYRGVFRDLSGTDAVPGAVSTETLPSAPSGVSATPLSSAVLVAWGSVVGAVTYRVWRSLSSGGPYILASEVSAPTTSASIGGLSDGTPYYFVVTTVDDVFNESVESAESSATPGSVATYSLFAGGNVYFLQTGA